MPALPEHLTIGEVSARSGVATSALRYYESIDLIASERTAGNQRRYPRAVLRRLAFIRAAQYVGLSIEDIKAGLDHLPRDGTPNKADWAKVARAWNDEIQERILALRRIQNTLTGCTGCGCLSLKKCPLSNPGDEQAETGPGPAWLTTPERH